MEAKKDKSDQEKYKLDDIQDMLESYISFFSENYTDHVKCGLIIRSLRSAADDIHHVRFDKAINENYKQKEEEKMEVKNDKN